MAPGRKMSNGGMGNSGFGKQGSNIGGGPVGQGGFSGRPGMGGNSNHGDNKGFIGGSSSGLGPIIGILVWLIFGRRENGNSNGGARRGLSIGKLIRIAIIVIIGIYIFRACTSVSYSFSNYGTPTSYNSYVPYDNGYSGTVGYSSQSSANAQTQPVLTTENTAISNVNANSVSTGWTVIDNNGVLNTNVASGSRAKFYNPQSGDKVNLMIYMIGTDLESNYGMGTSDLLEITKANISSDINLFVYGGGCTGWQNNVMSNSSNYIYKIENGGKFIKLADDGNKTMTEPSTLSGYIKAVANAYPAERSILILWDHGGGSITGYGYDQRHKNSGAMDLNGIDEALTDAGVKFDFVGFDACLMATAENAIMLSDHADYLIGSEESEPGIGWYYTNWINTLSNNTAVSTLELGKQIADDFVEVCAQQCYGQDTTLSVVDLAEVANTLPSKINSFYSSTTNLISKDSYKTVAVARSKAHEFAKSSCIDQCDLVGLAANMNTNEGNALAKAVEEAVKYNRVGSTVDNAYGLSVYFPYKQPKIAKSAAQALGNSMGDEYAKCVQAFAGIQSTSQSSYSNSGYSINPYDFLSGNSGYSSGSYSDIYSILEQMMGGRSLGIDTERTAQYLTDNQFNPSGLVWSNGKITLSDEDWSLIDECKLSLFIDDGEGFIDMGYDLREGDFTEDGSLAQQFNGMWVSINGYFVPFYQLMSSEQNTMGYIPALYNGERAQLIVVFDENGGSLVGVRLDYANGNKETDTVAKTVVQLGQQASFDVDGDVATLVSGDNDVVSFKEGDVLTFIADYYDYDGNYKGTYQIWDDVKVDGDLEVYDVYLNLDSSMKVNTCFKLTDIYGNVFWTPSMQ